ncbi:MAG: Gfo/Idh/MocA family oxidoreductase [Saprospiraceae bacterium]|nr:Gfo/Idh/MocA family oxidoreductase [Saprospiraceae bacterium]
MIRIGVFGVGHLGKIHLKCLQQTPFEVVGFFDPNDEAARGAVDDFHIKRFENEEELLSLVDAVDIVTPTPFHYKMAMKALSYGKHLFIEKPVTHDIGEARILVDTVAVKGVIAQVGHVERFNPAFTSLTADQLHPQFIESHRLATFNPRGTDVSVVLDLMIHDLDLILNLVDGEVVDVMANGVKIVSSTPDICNTRLTFSNGCVANVTASRISLKNMRKLRLFQEDAYISIDFLEKESQIITLSDQNIEGSLMPIDTFKGKRYINMSTKGSKDNNAIVDELNNFYSSVTTGRQPQVTIMDGYRALELASRIEQAIGH